MTLWLHKSFCNRIGNGTWTNDGITTDVAEDVIEGNTTMVQCTSTHLTSFAVLVSVARGLEVLLLKLS